MRGVCVLLVTICQRRRTLQFAHTSSKVHVVKQVREYIVSWHQISVNVCMISISFRWKINCLFPLTCLNVIFREKTRNMKSYLKDNDSSDAVKTSDWLLDSWMRCTPEHRAFFMKKWIRKTLHVSRETVLLTQDVSGPNRFKRYNIFRRNDADVFIPV